jgi:hypothetical protein
MANTFRSLFHSDGNNALVSFSISHLKNRIKTDPAIPLIIVSLGILLTASSGSWDITNHLLNRPETFFSPPHIGLYSGVALALFGSLITCRYHRYSSSKISNIKNKKSMPIYVQLILTGIIMLVSSGPLDFAWHSAFGLDGLLSPPHAVLTIGMALCSIGAFLGLISSSIRIHNYGIKTTSSKNDRSQRIILNRNNSSNITRYENRSPLYIIIAITAVWITVSGIIHMVSLPFSDTDFFKFNPSPILAALIATLCFPFLVSFILFTSWRITKKFGVLSVSGMIFIFINLVTTILPNENLVSTIPFYFLNVIPIIAIDALLSLTTAGMSPPLLLSQTRRKIISILSGIIFGLIFFMLYYPIITHTYNEVLANPQPVWPSVTASVYFGMIDEMYPLLVVSSMATGILGVVISSKLTAQTLNDIHGMTK